MAFHRNKTATVINEDGATMIAFLLPSLASGRIKVTGLRTDILVRADDFTRMKHIFTEVGPLGWLVAGSGHTGRLTMSLAKLTADTQGNFAVGYSLLFGTFEFVVLDEPLYMSYSNMTKLAV